MRVFACGNCGQLVYFENSRCERCGSQLGFAPEPLALVALRPAPDGSETYQPLDGAPPVQRCANAQTAGCNWLVPAGAASLCPA
ncbi:MAG: zinc-ribbon domain-containing protein, partial [Rhodobacteraceae bacterium]|nr:zinc-ribbon domain-containing protein [Paracoccaceae bacterium]